MPICSDARHALPYRSSANEAELLADIERLLHTTLETSVSTKFKKLMLHRVIWLVVESTGNFYCRYRSAGVIAGTGEHIQRDHIFTRKELVAELLTGSADVKDIIARAQCCVVTHAEHVALSKASKLHRGFDRYTNAVPPVAVHDMLTQQRVA